MVAGRGRDDAALLLLVGELRQPVPGAALLERGGVVQVLELDPDLGPGQLRQLARAAARRAVDVPLDALGGGFDVGEGQGRSSGRQVQVQKARGPYRRSGRKTMSPTARKAPRTAGDALSRSRRRG